MQISFIGTVDLYVTRPAPKNIFFFTFHTEGDNLFLSLCGNFFFNIIQISNV